MKKLIALLSLLLLTTSNSCEEETYACYCLDYHETESKYTTQLIELHVTYTGTELAKFLDKYMNNQPNSITDKIRLYKNVDDEYVNSPNIGYAEATDTSEITQSLQSFVNENKLDSTNIRFIWSKNVIKFVKNDTLYYTLYALKPITQNEIGITNKDLNSARKSLDPDNGDIGISITFNDEGAVKLHKFSTKNVGEFIAISSYNKVLSAPNIVAPIPGGEILIAGKFSSQEADTLRDWINCDAYARRVGQDVFEKEIAKCQ